MKIYLASSWKNEYYSHVLEILRDEGHDVYDFRTANGSGFSWTSIDENWKDWVSSRSNYIAALNHPLAVEGFNFDFKAINECDVCVMLMPCGVSASLEAGYAKGCGKKLIVYIPELQEKNIDLMVKIADMVTPYLEDVLYFLNRNSYALEPDLDLDK